MGNVAKQIHEPDHTAFMPKSLWCSHATSSYTYKIRIINNLPSQRAHKVCHGRPARTSLNEYAPTHLVRRLCLRSVPVEIGEPRTRPVKEARNVSKYTTSNLPMLASAPSPPLWFEFPSGGEGAWVLVSGRNLATAPRGHVPPGDRTNLYAASSPGTLGGL